MPLGGLSTNVWVLLRYRALSHFTMEIILSFLQDMMNPPVKCWLCWMPCAMAYSTTWISLRLNTFSHDVESSFPLQQISKPTVDILKTSHSLTTIFWSSTQRAKPFFCDQQMHLIKPFHSCQHHIWYTLIL